METIRIEHLSFKYPLADRPALDDISLEIPGSSFVVLCGKSGCGKSTLLRHLKKNLTPYGAREGGAYYKGMDIYDLDDRINASKIGYVQQNPDNQIVTDKVWHELSFGLESLGYDNGTIKRRVAEMASFFDIQGWFRKSVTELSGGQKQLLNVASIMVMQPDVLVLDEPTAQLDPIAASEFIKTLYRINRELGTTVIISEHRLEELFSMADKVIVMDEGKVIHYGEPGEVGMKLAASAHPMFFGLPAVMKIFAGVDGKGHTPMSIRDGRLWLESLLGKPEEKEYRYEPEKKTGICSEDIITLKNIYFKYDRKSGDVLHGLNMSVKRGEWYCILGGNGVGKSTSLKIICGILKAQSGTAVVDGIDVKKAGEELFDHRLAMVPQNPQALFTEITVEEELLEALEFMGLKDDEKVERARKMIDMMELAGLNKAHPYDLSGGEQQRLAIGKVLLLEPKILVMDEPTKGLDPFFKKTLAEILRKLKNEGVTIFMVSHDIEFCAENADRCAMFFDGDIVCAEEPAAFFSGNSFYTTTSNQVARQWFPKAVTCEEVTLCISNAI